jgi:acetyltransferase
VTERDRVAALGFGHFFADADKLRAEYAVAVRSDCKGRGAGFALMTGLIEIARHRGIGELTGEVLVENKPMLQMWRELGSGITAHPNDRSIVLVQKRACNATSAGRCESAP